MAAGWRIPLLPASCPVFVAGRSVFAISLWGSPHPQDSLDGEEGRSTDETQHEVAISKAFCIGVYEVTQAKYEAIMGTRQPSACVTRSARISLGTNLTGVLTERGRLVIVANKMS